MTTTSHPTKIGAFDSTNLKDLHLMKGNSYRSKMKLAPESRRVSKRNQERQKAEHDAARKEALENDIAYRLKVNVKMSF